MKVFLEHSSLFRSGIRTCNPYNLLYRRHPRIWKRNAGVHISRTIYGGGGKRSCFHWWNDPNAETHGAGSFRSFSQNLHRPNAVVWVELYRSRKEFGKKKELRAEESQGPNQKKPQEGRGATVLAFMILHQCADQSVWPPQFIFLSMFSLHRWLLIGDTGKLITGISTSVFLFILITGIILWWPRIRRF